MPCFIPPVLLHLCSPLCLYAHMLPSFVWVCGYALSFPYVLCQRVSGGVKGQAQYCLYDSSNSWTVNTNTADIIHSEDELHRSQQASALTPSRRTGQALQAARGGSIRTEGCRSSSTQHASTSPSPNGQCKYRNLARRTEDLSVNEEHGDVHRRHREDDVGPRVLRGGERKGRWLK